MPDKICVIIFTCDRPDDLRRALDSVVRQAFGDIQLIVVNNGTAIKTNEILDSYNSRVIKDTTKRLSYLFNLGWKNTDSEFIGYLADDAEIKPDWIKAGINTLHKYPDAAVVTGPLVSPYEFTGEMHALYQKASKNPFLRFISGFYDKFILEGKTFEPCVLCESGSYTLGQGFMPNFMQEREVDLATTSSMIFRRSAIESIGGFDENFMFNHADGDLFVRLKKRGYKIIYNPNMRAIHYIRIGPSRYPFFIGRDTAYFYLKDVRPHSLRGALAALSNIIVLNVYWLYKTIQLRELRQLTGLTGFIKGIIDFIMR